MKSPYVSEIEPGKQFVTLFLVQSKEIRQKKTGEPYLSLVLCDRTGDVECKMWDNAAEVMDTFDRDDFVRVKAEAQIYQNRLQLTVHKLMRVLDGEIDIEDFLPSSRRNRDEMYSELRALVAGLGNPHLRSLLEAIFADPEIAEAFKRAPAAKGIHHAWLGGLLEHVLSLATLARLTAPHYPNVDLDLLMAGVLLHDLGKIHELSYSRTFQYSSEGQLLGHIAIGVRIVGDKLAGLPGFPPKLRSLVEHMILSHHGHLEYGSPKLPLFPEALLLHHLDNLDSKMEAMRALIAKERTTDSEWTAYSAALERSALDKELYLTGRPEQPANVAPTTNSGVSKPQASVAVAATQPAGSAAASQASKQATLFGQALNAALKEQA